MVMQNNMRESELPTGYTMRPAVFEDAEAIAKMANDYWAHFGVIENNKPEEFISDWKDSKFDIDRQTRIVFDADEKIVAFITVWNNSEIPVGNYISWTTQPNIDYDAVMTPVFDWAIAEARTSVDRCPPDVRVKVTTGGSDEDEARQRFIESQGLKHVRNFYRMLIEMDEAPPAPKLADGFIIRPFDYETELEKLVQALLDGFRDHWGFWEEPFEEEVRDFKEGLDNDEQFDESVHFVVVHEETGDFAGVCLCRDPEWGYDDVAYVKELAVVPKYRKKGIALAMLHHTFTEFWNRGRKDVALHVDASSLTGATRLYERAGMHVNRLFKNYELELRAGRDITTQTLEKSE